MKRWMLTMAVLLVVAAGCVRDDYADERSVALEFSDAELTFDTVFTAMGTATRQMRVYNRSAHDVELATVTLKKGRESRFRLNVDGDTSMVARNVELQAGDSLFIFVQANISPNDESEPFLCTDSIVFSNGQSVPLTAYGRNAVYHRLGADAETWYVPIDCAAYRHDRPHVFLSPAAVLEGSTLTLQAGDELYFGDGAMLVVDSAATLRVQGTAGQPVLFSSLRREEWYRALPGQWPCVWFYNYSVGNVIDHAVVENGVGGLRCYPGASLTVSNTVIRNMSDAGIVGQDATIVGDNLLVYDCYSAAVLIGGGNYSFSHCTFADYWGIVGRNRDTAAVVVSNYYPLSATELYAGHMRAAFSESIVYGTWSRGEVAVSRLEGLAMDTSFVRTVVRGGAWDVDPMFEDPATDNYRLREGSPAAGLGYNFEL